MKMLKGLVVPLVFAGWLLGGFDALGLTFLVTQTDDSIQETSLSGALLKKIKVRGAVIPEPSLRGAILAANRRGGFNTILLQPKTYQLSLVGADEDAARTGDLDIRHGHLTIMVVGKGNATINATGLGDRVFQISSNASLLLSHLTITGGSSSDGMDYFYEGGGGGVIITSSRRLAASDFLIDGSVGGAICNYGALALKNCIVAGNSAGDGVLDFIGGTSPVEFGGSGGSGGGIYNIGAASLDYCIVSNNFAGAGGGDSNLTIGGSGGSGGGIYNAGKMKLSFSSVNGNHSGNGGGCAGLLASGAGGNGAGIHNSGTLDANNSTISGNICGRGGNGGSGFVFRIYNVPADGGPGGNGGGIYNAGTLSLSACTIVLNATGPGGNGGIGGNGYTFSYSTFTYDSSAADANGGQGGSGGGVSNEGTNTVMCRQTILASNLASGGGQGGTNVIYFFGVPGFFFTLGSTNEPGNFGANGAGSNLSGDFISGGFNLLSASDGSTGFTNGVHADQVGSIAAPIDPLIGPLQMNGGPTPTHALLPGSPAIDQGKNFGQRFDQRGHRRPHDYVFISNAPGGDGADIGAFELDN